MHPHFLVSIFLLPACACVAVVVNQDKKEVTLSSGETCTMQCTAVQQPGVEYVSVRWYRVIGESRYGLITKRLPSGTTRWYGDTDRQVQFLNDSFTISVPNVTCGSGGEYGCQLSAPVGQQNRDGRVRLSVKDCPVIIKENPTAHTSLIIIASSVMILALLLFSTSYVCLKKTLKRRNKRIQKAALLVAPFEPLSKKDLMLIYTLGPKISSPKHLYV